MFSLQICDNEELLEYKNSFERTAVRAVIISGEKILLVKSNKGDYKFPGGGVEKGESHNQALMREVTEETGYKIESILGLIGEIKEVSKNKFESECAFIMYSYYYKCVVGEEVTHQKLDDYEQKLDFVGEWVDIKEAININENILADGNINNISWIRRETLALNNIYNDSKDK